MKRRGITADREFRIVKAAVKSRLRRVQLRRESQRGPVEDEAFIKIRKTGRRCQHPWISGQCFVELPNEKLRPKQMT